MILEESLAGSHLVQIVWQRLQTAPTHLVMVVVDIRCGSEMKPVPIGKAGLLWAWFDLLVFLYIIRRT